MRRGQAISILRGSLPALRRELGVCRLSLFGSTARDEAREDGDVGLLVDFEVGPTFDSFMGLEVLLENHLGRKVDLVTPDALELRMRPVVEREAVDVAWRPGLAALRRRQKDAEVVDTPATLAGGLTRPTAAPLRREDHHPGSVTGYFGPAYGTLARALGAIEDRGRGFVSPPPAPR